MRTEPFELKIVEHIATLGGSGTYTRELNVVSFNNRHARLDVRPVSYTHIPAGGF